MSTKKTPRDLALVRDALGQSGIDEGLKLSKGLHLGDVGMPAGEGDLWIENSIRVSTALSAAPAGPARRWRFRRLAASCFRCGSLGHRRYFRPGDLDQPDDDHYTRRLPGARVPGL